MLKPLQGSLLLPCRTVEVHSSEAVEDTKMERSQVSYKGKWKEFSVAVIFISLVLKWERNLSAMEEETEIARWSVQKS